ncbi:hypothetical protein HPP92_028720 [Vanilla planifolia]|uniref:Uncharacterized protein n=1 Tax=Vanilla planifolia TaxID=51239 RepID=A0A835P9X4_VANPL|nr:hypothetical protein HPP92_028720 [Vanilla planifolia]KAG0446712.1 hypothetical protein HPP92_028703 [Vanilla planifolia]
MEDTPPWPDREVKAYRAAAAVDAGGRWRSEVRRRRSLMVRDVSNWTPRCVRANLAAINSSVVGVRADTNIP